MASSKNGVIGIWKVYEKQVVDGVKNFGIILEELCDVFNMFIDTCLVHMVLRVTWTPDLKSDMI